ncbi:hypothetical protein BB559_005614 [Furculomyces boomerangus]|uniref:Transforming acidic coiled-coil-containing protein C-terminal domain-containing protein n=1 Tax=Furculomyces boomerangus TaxID=61424 RepID=A0A2T9Y7K6_9FUNG|nr:hypothetical protein BB559_005614 [Furculomyces boomerangus]
MDLSPSDQKHPDPSSQNSGFSDSTTTNDLDSNINHSNIVQDEIDKYNSADEDLDYNGTFPRSNTINNLLNFNKTPARSKLISSEIFTTQQDSEIDLNDDSLKANYNKISSNKKTEAQEFSDTEHNYSKGGFHLSNLINYHDTNSPNFIESELHKKPTSETMCDDTLPATQQTNSPKTINKESDKIFDSKDENTMYNSIHSNNSMGSMDVSQTPIVSRTLNNSSDKNNGIDENSPVYHPNNITDGSITHNAVKKDDSFDQESHDQSPTNELPALSTPSHKVSSLNKEDYSNELESEPIDDEDMTESPEKESVLLSNVENGKDLDNFFSKINLTKDINHSKPNKRAFIDTITPGKGTERKLRERLEFINSPLRAPPPFKKLMYSDQQAAKPLENKINDDTSNQKPTDIESDSLNNPTSRISNLFNGENNTISNQDVDIDREFGNIQNNKFTSRNRSTNLEAFDEDLHNGSPSLNGNTFEKHHSFVRDSTETLISSNGKDQKETSDRNNDLGIKNTPGSGTQNSEIGNQVVKDMDAIFDPFEPISEHEGKIPGGKGFLSAEQMMASLIPLPISPPNNKYSDSSTNELNNDNYNEQSTNPDIHTRDYSVDKEMRNNMKSGGVKFAEDYEHTGGHYSIKKKLSESLLVPLTPAGRLKSGDEFSWESPSDSGIFKDSDLEKKLELSNKQKTDLLEKRLMELTREKQQELEAQKNMYLEIIKTTELKLGQKIMDSQTDFKIDIEESIANQKILESKIDILEAELASYKNLVEHMTNENNVLDASNSDIKKQLELVSTEFKTFKESSLLTQQLYESSQKKYNEEKETNSTFIQEEIKKAVEKNIEEQKQTTEKLLNETKEAHALEIAKINKENDEKLASLESKYTKEIRGLKQELFDEMSNHLETKKEYKEYMAISGQYMDGRDRENEGLTRELANLTLERQGLTSEVQMLNQQLEQIQQEFVQIESRVGELSSRNTELEKENKVLENDLNVAVERENIIVNHFKQSSEKESEKIAELDQNYKSASSENEILKAQLTRLEFSLKRSKVEINNLKEENQELNKMYNDLENIMSKNRG